MSTPSRAPLPGDLARQLRKFKIAAGLDAGGWWLAGGLSVAGGLILVLKATGYHHFCPPAWILAGLLPLLLLIAWLGRQSPYARADVAAWLDLKNGCGGRLIQWAEHPDSSAAPALNMEAGLSLMPLARRLALPAFFLLACLLAPGAGWESEVSSRLLNHRAQQVRSRLEALQAAQILPPRTVEALAQQIERAGQSALSPEMAAEALDQAQQELERQLLRQAEELQKSLYAAARAAESGEAPTAAELAQALAALPDESLWPEELKKALAELGQHAGCQPGQKPGEAAARLAGLDAKSLKKLAQTLAQLHERRLSACAGCRDCLTNAALRRQLESLLTAGKCSNGLNSRAQTACQQPACQQPGVGDVTRGRGDAPLGFGRESSAEGVKFTPRTLPASPEGFIPGVPVAQTRISGGQPPPEFSLPARSGVQLGPTGGGELSGAALGPSRRAVAARYFAEKKP